MLVCSSASVPAFTRLTSQRPTDSDQDGSCPAADTNVGRPRHGALSCSSAVANRRGAGHTAEATSHTPPANETGGGR